VKVGLGLKAYLVCIAYNRLTCHRFARHPSLRLRRKEGAEIIYERHCEEERRGNPLLTERPCYSAIATLRSQWRVERRSRSRGEGCRGRKLSTSVIARRNDVAIPYLQSGPATLRLPHCVRNDVWEKESQSERGLPSEA